MLKRIIYYLTPLLFLYSCKIDSKKKINNSPLNIVCTTGMLGDATAHVIGNHGTVTTLMGPGVDPHLYKATQGDLKVLSNADVIIHNGLHLEGKMGEIFEKLKTRKHIITAAEAIDESALINNSDFSEAHDPHLWFDVSLWSKVVLHIGSSLGNLSDSLQPEYNENASIYAQQLLALHDKVKLDIQSIPLERRVLITAHDAFAYFGKAYDIEVRGLQGISTVSEYGLKDVSDLVRYITDNQIKAIFVESSVSERSLEAVVEGCKELGHPVRIGGTLFSDAMGNENTPEGTYIGMVNYNVSTIIKGLND